MATELPDELWHLIIDQLAHSQGGPRAHDLASLALVSRRFAFFCQESLFHSVEIHVVPDKRRAGLRRYIPTKRRVAYEKTVQFAKVVNSSARLASFVRDLDIRLPTKDRYETDATQDDILSALHKLEALDSLSLSPSQLDGTPPTERAAYHISMPRVMQTSFGATLRLPQLRRLRLTNIILFPEYLILGAPQLRELEIQCSTLTRDSSSAAHSVDWHSLPAGNLETLTYDAHSSEGVTRLLQTSLAQDPSTALKLSRLTSLEIQPPDSIEEDPDFTILKHFVCLQRLTVPAWHKPPPGSTSPSQTSPLSLLSPLSFCTLTRLTLTPLFDVYQPASQTFSADPYLGALPFIFKNLINLSSLSFNIQFNFHFLQYWRAFPYDKFKPAFHLLSDAFNRLGMSVNPSLRSVTVNVKLRLHEPKWMLAPKLQMQQLIKDAESLFEILNGVILPTEVGSLDGCERGGVRLSVLAEAGMEVVRRRRQ